MLAQNHEITERRTALEQEYTVKEQTLRNELESLKQQLQEQRRRDALIQTDQPNISPPTRSFTDVNSPSALDDRDDSYRSDFEGAGSVSSYRESETEIEEEDVPPQSPSEAHTPGKSSPLSPSYDQSSTHSEPTSPIRSELDYSVHSEEVASEYAPTVRSEKSPTPFESPNSNVDVRSDALSARSSSLPESPVIPTHRTPSPVGSVRYSETDSTSSHASSRTEDDEMGVTLTKLEDEIGILEKLKTNFTTTKGA